MVRKKLSKVFCLFLGVLGLVLNLAKIPGDFDASHKLPAGFEALVDGLGAAQYAPPIMTSYKKKLNFFSGFR